MIITDYAVKRRTTTFVLMFLCLVSGVYAYLILPREAAPDMRVVIDPNRRFHTVENTLEIARALEGHDVVIEDPIPRDDFSDYIEIEDALRKVKDEVDGARGKLPQEADDPMVREINISEFPIMVLSIHGKVQEDRVLSKH